jgi:hypothetical protein
MKAEEVMKIENVGKKYKVFGREFTLKMGVDGESVYLASDDAGEDIEDIYNFYSLLYGNYEEIIQWDKVDVDTKILVSETGNNWERRYFAKYEYNKVYVWDYGATSYSCNHCSTWKYAKLYEEGEE